MQQSCTHAQGNCFFPVNKDEEEIKEEKEEVEEEENKEEEEEDKDDKFTTAMQFSTAMQQSCTRGPRQLFLFSEQGVRVRRWRRRRSQLQCSLL